MPTTLISELNRPTAALLTAAELNAGQGSVAIVTFDVDYTQQFMLKGILAEFNANINDAGTIINQFFVRGVENRRLRVNQTAQQIFNEQNSGRTIYNADNNTVTVNYRISDLFGVPIIYPNSGAYSFFAGMISPNVAFNGNCLVTLTVYGDIISRNRKDFPWETR